MNEETSRLRRFYGRRHGRKLRSRRKRLLEEFLPSLEVKVSDDTIDPRGLFPRSWKRYWLEVGFGGGEHLAIQAEAHPEVGFIGCEPYMNGVARFLTDVEALSLANVRIYPDDATILLDRLVDASIERVFLLFPDPWQKKRHAARRFINSENLATLARVMRDSAEFRIASDEMAYIRRVLKYVRANRNFEWTASSAEDWRQRPPDWPPSRYESKALAAGRQCVYLRICRRNRS